MWLCTKFVFIICVSVLVGSSTALNCYQCSGSDSNNPFQCNEWLTSDIDITPQPCDNVYGAQYCIKHVGRFEAYAMKCYQCSATKSTDCSDGMIQLGGIEPNDCSDVFEAEYCIKTFSLNGGIGAKRFCSSLDLGNYCNYVKQPGDILNYRTCVFTCTGDGCNPAGFTKPNYLLMTLLGFLLCIYFSL
ncbi:glycosylphosphatidylinositol anchored membrane protein boudin isoform X2 [Leptinotarsa decemlineata]|uniref:glycosylphosphatidylinositol anchored membrane protein boudin isoform X2 n=1 Tax=Leptinotarsa decemlineata TaxID=7539 RepID=UPI003D3051AF